MKKQKTTHIFAKISSIRDCCDRLNYISSPDRQQEKLVLAAGNMDMGFWKALAQQSQQNSKNTKKTISGKRKGIEAVEFIVNLPNEVLDMSETKQMKVLHSLIRFTVKKTGTECMVGLHNSHEGQEGKEGNCHVHILISDRVKLPQPKTIVADRNYFINEQGKRVRTKKDILNSDGNIRKGCRIIRKGDVWKSDIFGSKYAEMSTELWLARMKQNYCDWINETLSPDLVRKVYDPDESLFIPYIHKEKGASQQIINNVEIANRNIRVWNNAVREGKIMLDEDARIYRDLIALSPSKSKTILQLYNGINNHIENGYIVPAKQLLQEQLREEYRLATVNRKAAKETADARQRQQYIRLAAQHSANIDRINRRLGQIKPERYLRELHQAQEELARLQTESEKLKYWIYVLSKAKSDEAYRRWKSYCYALKEMQEAEINLARQIRAHNIRWEAVGFNEQKIPALSFDRILESIRAREQAKEAINHDYSTKESYFGPPHKKAQAMMDTIALFRQYDIDNIYHLKTKINNIGVILHRVKNDLDLSEKVRESIRHIPDIIIELNKINYRIKESYENGAGVTEIAKLQAEKNKIVEELQNENINSAADIKNFLKRYERLEINIRELTVQQKEAEAEYLKLKKAEYVYYVGQGNPFVQDITEVNYFDLRLNTKITIDYDHTPPDTSDYQLDF